MTKESDKATGAPARDVDSYLATVPEDARAALERLRKTIKTAAPKATEVISYQIPTYKYNGPLVAFAAFPKHCGLYVMSTTVMDTHKDEPKSYDTAKTTTRFPLRWYVRSSRRGLQRTRLA